MALKGSYEPYEFEKECLLPSVDILYTDAKDGGHLESVLLNYEAEMVEQPLLLTQSDDRPGQQLPLFRVINVLILRGRIDKRLLIYLIEGFVLLTPG
jgi:hypothetical protein